MERKLYVLKWQKIELKSRAKYNGRLYGSQLLMGCFVFILKIAKGIK